MTHDGARNEQRPEAVCAQETAKCSGGVQSNAIERMAAGAENARHPIADCEGAQETKVVENDHPAHIVRTACDVSLKVRKQDID